MPSLDPTAWLLLVMWALETLWHRLDLHRWERERERLLDRWQSPTLESFKAAQREVRAAKQRAVKADQPGTRLSPVDYDEVPDDLETAPRGQGLVDDVISGRARSALARGE
jgi:hypothetical protein